MNQRQRWAIQSALLGSFLLSLLGLFVVPAQANMQAAGQPAAAPPVVDLGLPPPGGEAAAAAPALTQGSMACPLSRELPAAVYRWCELITVQAQAAGIPPDLVAAVILVESGGDPDAYSRSGAVGLMQVMPRDGRAASFRCVNGPCFADRPITRALLDPVFNVTYGVHLLAELIERHGEWRAALKAYGPMDVGYSYADRVLGVYQRYRR